MAAHLSAIKDSIGTDSFAATLQKEFTAIEGKSIDYAVKERYKNVKVVEAPFQWDDLGNWTALPRQRGVDEEGNTIDAKHLGIKTSNTIVRSDDDHLIVTVGMEDCIVVRTADATLIANRNDESAVKEVVKRLGEAGWNEYL